MKRDTNRTQSGFTLLEMLLVTSMIGVIAGIAVPNLLGGRIVANESNAIATLRAISTAQLQFQSGSLLDQDNDGAYEFGTLGELGALEVLRGTSDPIARNLLSRSVVEVDASGTVTRSGYHVRLYLPAEDGAGVIGTQENAASIDPSMSERYWSCVAWPIKAGTTGNRAFFINQQGQLMELRDSPYSGATSIPDAGCALVGSDPVYMDTETLATSAPAADGGSWTMVQ
jgi:prepilin-type N-terminal cleavage/methylation domain-containing protein